MVVGNMILGKLLAVKPFVGVACIIAGVVVMNF